MRIYEMFKQTDIELIIEELVKTPGFFWEVDMDRTISDVQRAKIKSRIKQLYAEEITKIKSNYYKIEDVNDSIIVAHKRVDDDEVYYDTARFYKKDFDKVKDFDPERPEEFKNPTVCVIFEERKIILGLECSDFCIKRYKPECILASMLREMCFFGIDDAVSRGKKEEVEQELLDAVKESENYGPEDYLSEEDVWKELGWEDKRTPEEKEAQRMKIYNDCVINIKEMIYVYTKAVEEARK